MPATTEVAVDANGYQIDGSPVSPARLATELRAPGFPARLQAEADTVDADRPPS